MKIITVEEHFMSKTVNEQYKKIRQGQTEIDAMRDQFVDQFIENSLIMDLGEKRIAFMDEHGVTSQIIGYGNNSPMHFSLEEGAVLYCKLANDELFEASQRYKGRIYGFATLPVADIEASVKELERCVIDLGFKGWMLNGMFNHEFFDAERFYPIFEKAAELDVPVYLHPNPVADEVAKTYYEGAWSPAVANIFSGYALGWHYDTGIHLMRLILSGLLDKLPNLKLIVGHWGEMLPYYLKRTSGALNPQLTGLKHDLLYYFEHNIYTNPSGMFDQEEFAFCLKVLPKEKILWAQDFPYLAHTGHQVHRFLEDCDLPFEVKEDVAFRNAEKLFKL